MGADLMANYPAAAQVFEAADRILGIPFTKLMMEGSAETLDATLHTQPALYIHGVAVWRALESVLGTPIQPIVVAGHSLGELTALTVAGALSFEDGLHLVRCRAELMDDAGQKSKGAMAALLGIDAAEVRALCAEASDRIGQPVVLANDNCPGQIVISGDQTALELALTLAKERGVKRSVRLAVSIAAHSPLMQDAATTFSDVLKTIPFESPSIPIIGNVNATPLPNPDAILTELETQMVSPVCWTQSIEKMRSMGATTFLELGPKDVLTGLLRRIDKTATGIAVNSAEVIDQLVGSN